MEEREGWGMEEGGWVSLNYDLYLVFKVLMKIEPRSALLLFSFIMNTFNNINKDCVDILRTVGEKVKHRIGTLFVLLLHSSCLVINHLFFQHRLIYQSINLSIVILPMHHFII